MEFCLITLNCCLYPLPSSSLVLRYVEPSNGVAHVDDGEGFVNVCILPMSWPPTSDMFKPCIMSSLKVVIGKGKLMLTPADALRRPQHTIRTLTKHDDDELLLLAHCDLVLQWRSGQRRWPEEMREEKNGPARSWRVLLLKQEKVISVRI
ncbi:hypothetical protein CPC08DRAFT_770712 [Agrocybe pediades]|nr:hypothetical protein CPC08DRAFT_770712 [Agrocybe pediades]